MKRIGEYVSKVFLFFFEKGEFRGIIIGGFGLMKEEFVEGDYFYYEFRKKVIGVVDISYYGEYGLREFVEKVSDIFKDYEVVKEC